MLHFDNLEMILALEGLMSELASLIIRLDDSRYAAHNVKLLIVGVPSNVKRYLSKSHASVGNRLTEVPEVSSLSAQQVSTLIKTGFVELLRVSIDTETLDNWQKHIFRVTMGYPQPVQEYCEQLGYIWRNLHGFLKPITLSWPTQLG